MFSAKMQRDYGRVLRVDPPDEELVRGSQGLRHQDPRHVGRSGGAVGEIREGHGPDQLGHEVGGAGLEIDGSAMRNFPEILEEKWRFQRR